MGVYRYASLRLDPVMMYQKDDNVGVWLQLTTS